MNRDFDDDDDDSSSGNREDAEKAYDALSDSFEAAVKKALADERLEKAKMLKKQAEELERKASAIVVEVAEEHKVPIAWDHRDEGYMPDSIETWIDFEKHGSMVAQWMDDLISGEFGDPNYPGWWQPSQIC